MATTIQPLELEGIYLVRPRIFPDSRGFFFETFKESEFHNAGLKVHFVQENHSSSSKGVLRGLHYQRAPKAQGKLVRVLSGAIFDVVVDMREESPTCGKWLGVELSAENRHQLYVSPGFAHGFCVLSDQAEITYLVTEEYSPGDEGGVAWNDPFINVSWPCQEPAVSDKDRQWGPFAPLPKSIWRG